MKKISVAKRCGIALTALYLAMSPVLPLPIFVENAGAISGAPVTAEICNELAGYETYCEQIVAAVGGAGVVLGDQDILNAVAGFEASVIAATNQYVLGTIDETGFELAIDNAMSAAIDGLRAIVVSDAEDAVVVPPYDQDAEDQAYTVAYDDAEFYQQGIWNAWEAAGLAFDASCADTPEDPGCAGYDAWYATMPEDTVEEYATFVAEEAVKALQKAYTDSVAALYENAAKDAGDAFDGMIVSIDSILDDLKADLIDAVNEVIQAANDAVDAFIQGWISSYNDMIAGVLEGFDECEDESGCCCIEATEDYLSTRVDLDEDMTIEEIATIMAMDILYLAVYNYSFDTFYTYFDVELRGILDEVIADSPAEIAEALAGLSEIIDEYIQLLMSMLPTLPQSYTLTITDSTVILDLRELEGFVNACVMISSKSGEAGCIGGGLVDFTEWGVDWANEGDIKLLIVIPCIGEIGRYLYGETGFVAVVDDQRTVVETVVNPPVLEETDANIVYTPYYPVTPIVDDTQDDGDTNGDGATDNKPEEKNAEETKEWSVINLILTAITTVISIGLLVGVNANDSDRARRKRLLSVIPAIVAILLFVFAEDMSLPIAVFNGWSPLVILLTAAEIFLAVQVRGSLADESSSTEKK